MKIDYPITFLYYRDLERVIPFYRDLLGLRLARDQGWCKIFAITPEAYVGLVDEQMGSLAAADEKGVLLTFVVDDVDGWHEHLLNSDFEVKSLTAPTMNEDIGVYGFFFEDPEGYMIEIQQFVDES